jgi:hypothetical protein
MPEKKSAAEILRDLSGVVRRIESDAAALASRAAGVAAVLEKLVDVQSRRQGEPGSGKGPSPVAAPGAS